jgi:hypothetical protein
MRRATGSRTAAIVHQRQDADDLPSLRVQDAVGKPGYPRPAHDSPHCWKRFGMQRQAIQDRRYVLEKSLSEFDPPGFIKEEGFEDLSRRLGRKNDPI